MKKATAEPVLAYLIMPTESSRIWENGTQITVYRLASSDQGRENSEEVFKRRKKSSSLICAIPQIISAFDTPQLLTLKQFRLMKIFLKK